MLSFFLNTGLLSQSKPVQKWIRNFIWIKAHLFPGWFRVGKRHASAHSYGSCAAANLPCAKYAI